MFSSGQHTKIIGPNFKICTALSVEIQILINFMRADMMTKGDLLEKYFFTTHLIEIWKKILNGVIKDSPDKVSGLIF